MAAPRTTAWTQPSEGQRLSGRSARALWTPPISQGPVAGTPCLELAGEVDGDCYPDILRALLELASGGSAEIVLDMRHVAFVDSSGLESLVSCRLLLAAGEQELRLVNITDDVCALVVMSGLLMELDV